MATASRVDKVIEGTGSDGQRRSVVIEAVRMITNHPGGLANLAQVFQQNGIGHVLSSWIGNGENAAISSEQVKAVLGSQKVGELANKIGISPEKAAQYLSATLPNLVDALTPEGKEADSGQLQARGRDILAALRSTTQPAAQQA
jgi:uncharacterized protein YidB (DUF937 family)